MGFQLILSKWSGEIIALFQAGKSRPKKKKKKKKKKKDKLRSWFHIEGVRGETLTIMISLLNYYPDISLNNSYNKVSVQLWYLNWKRYNTYLPWSLICWFTWSFSGEPTAANLKKKKKKKNTPTLDHRLENFLDRHVPPIESCFPLDENQKTLLATSQTLWPIQNFK